MNTIKTHLKFNNFLKGVQLLKHKKKIHVYLIKIEPFIKTIILVIKISIQFTISLIIL